VLCVAAGVSSPIRTVRQDIKPPTGAPPLRMRIIDRFSPRAPRPRRGNACPLRPGLGVAGRDRMCDTPSGGRCLTGGPAPARVSLRATGADHRLLVTNMTEHPTREGGGYDSIVPDAFGGGGTSMHSGRGATSPEAINRSHGRRHLPAIRRPSLSAHPHSERERPECTALGGAIVDPSMRSESSPTDQGTRSVSMLGA
jgi:hypothetical protein